MSDRPFLDTNILVYAKLEDESSLEKRASAIALIEKIKTNPVISVQVLNEFASVLIKHNVPNQSIKDAVQQMIDSLTVIILSVELIWETWRVRDKYKFSYWDSMIVATAINGGCETLYSEDLQNGQVIDNQLTIINPFL